MDVNELINVLNRILDLGDTLDNSGAGAAAATGGEHTTRGIIKIELGLFLLYIGDAGSAFNDGQASLVNILLSERFGQIPSWNMKSIAEGLDAPDPDGNTSFTIFQNADQAMVEQNGGDPNRLTNILITLYDTFGKVMIGLNQNYLAQVRFDRYMNGLKARQIVAPVPAPKPVAPAKPVVSKPAAPAKPAASKPATGKSTAAKKTTANKTASKPSGSVKTYKYDSRVSFELPAKYTYTDEKDDDGDRKVSVSFTPPAINGEEQKEVSFNISITNNEDTSKDLLDRILEANSGDEITRRYNSNPEAVLVINAMNMGILGVSIKMNVYRLYIRLSHDQALTILRMGVPGDDKEEERDLGYLMDFWKTVVIDGKKAETGNVDKKDITAQAKQKQKKEEQNDKIRLKNQITVEGNTVQVGDRWKMELPFGWRAKTKREEENDYTFMSVYAGSVPTGNFAFGDTVGIQKKCNTASTAATIKETLNATKLVDDKTIYSDDSLDVIIKCTLSAKGICIGEIRTKEKKLANNETVLPFVLTPGIEDMEEVVQKLKDKEYGIEHPFGREFEKKWNGVLKIAMSIRPLDAEEPEEISLGERVTLFKEFTGCVPAELKLLKGKEDEIDVYYPAKGKPSKKDFQENAFPYFLKIHTLELDDPGNADGRTNTRAGVLACHLVQTILGPTAEPLYENYLENGYKALWLNPANDGVCLSAVTVDAAEMLIQIPSNTGLSPAELVRIGKAIYDTIEIDGEAEEANAVPFPNAPDILHEHYTLVESGQYTTHRDADFIGQPIRELMEKEGTSDETVYEMMAMEDDTYDLDTKAVSLARVFRLNKERFDPYNDTEAMIRMAVLKQTGAIHALRSLAWLVSARADREGRKPEDYSFEELERIGDFIQENNNLVYQDYSYCAGLCDHYDWHVFYVPDDYLRSDESRTEDLRYLTGKENRGGNSVSFFMPGISSLGGMRSVSNLISRNEETMVSLESLRKDLADMLHVMETIHDGLLEGRDRNEQLAGPLPDALAAWCALAVAAKEPFYSEEAADTPEANAGLDGPLERPDDVLDDKPLKKATNTAAKKTVGKATKATAPKAAPKAAPKPAGDVLDLGGATVITPGQFSGNMGLKKVIIPEGVTEIGEMAFYSCMFLESVVFPSTLKKIGKMAFMSCRNLSKVELPDGIEEIGDHAFGATNNLKEVRLPDSLKKVDRTLFGMGGDSPYATAYMSGDLACRLMEEYNKGKSWPSDAIYARHYVIDGAGYEEMSDFWKKVKDGTVKPAKAPKAEPKQPAQAAPAPAEKPAAKPAGTTEKKPAAAKPGTKPASTKSGTKTATTKSGTTPAAAKPKAKTGTRTINLRGATVIKVGKFWDDTDPRPIIIPEGVTTIESSAFTRAMMESVTLPKSLKKIGDFAFNECKNLQSVEIQDGLEEIGFMSFGKCRKLNDLYLPDSIKTLDKSAFISNVKNHNSNVTIHLSGKLARYLDKKNEDKFFPTIYAKELVIDGNTYPDLDTYLNQNPAGQPVGKEPQRVEQRPQEEQQSQPKPQPVQTEQRPQPKPQPKQEEQRPQAIPQQQPRPAVQAVPARDDRNDDAIKEALRLREQEKQARRNELTGRIQRLEQERDSLKGLFAGMKRKKIQKEIDELKEQLRIS